MGGIFGGSKQKQTSSSVNVNNSLIKDTFTPTAQTTGTASNALMSLLGLGGGGGAGQDQAFQNFRDNSGYDFQMDQGTRAITGSNAAKGLLNSGSTVKGLATFGQGLADQSLNSYLDKIFQLGNLGLGAGGLITQAGQTSESKGSSKSKPGIGGALGSIAGGIAASDRRLKKDIVKLRELDNGLGVYQYNYINDRGPYIGVMADEVAVIVPEALGPEIGGYMTVDYGKIGGL